MDIGQWIWYGIAVGITASSWCAVFLAINAAIPLKKLGEREHFLRFLFWGGVCLFEVLAAIEAYQKVGLL
jgi:hypothetical protein